MSLFRGLFVRKDATRGTTPVEARKALAGLIAPAAASGFGVRPGILRGLVVAGTGAWQYSVAAGYAVTSRSAADGGVLFGNDAAALVDTSAAPATGSRIDIVYVQHLDVDAGDATSDVVLAVAQGAASGTPVAPTIPTGALELARATVTQAATSTSDAGTTITQTGGFSALAGADFQVPTEDALDRIVDPINGSRAWSDADQCAYVRISGAWEQVITTADDAEWTGTTFASGFTGAISALRNDRSVTINVTMSGPLTFTVSNLISVINAGVIPAAFLPNNTPDNHWGSAYFSGGSLGSGLAVIDTTGLVRLFRGSAASNTGAQFTISYLLAPDA